MSISVSLEINFIKKKKKEKESSVLELQATFFQDLEWWSRYKSEYKYSGQGCYYKVWFIFLNCNDYPKKMTDIFFGQKQ